jgi:hypothetical protein
MGYILGYFFTISSEVDVIDHNFQRFFPIFSEKMAPPLIIDRRLIDRRLIDRQLIELRLIDRRLIDRRLIDLFIGRILQHRPPIDRQLWNVDRCFL